MTIQQLKQVQVYSNEILEIIETQVRNDENSMTYSDLQGVIDALVYKIMLNSMSRKV